MAFFTKREARAAAQNRGSGFKTHAQLLQESVASTRDLENFDIFLSHSSRDAELIRGIKLILESMNFTVYVDWIVDPQLDRGRVTKSTAAVLRKRMSQCKSLIFVATENASESRWMPWELGYFDGLRQSHVAILPLTDSADEKFHGQEYLGLYPIVRKDQYIDGRADVFVEEIGNRWTTLAKFGKGGTGWSAYSR